MALLPFMLHPFNVEKCSINIFTVLFKKKSSYLNCSRNLQMKNGKSC